MPLDPWSIVLSLVLSVFGFLVFLLVNKRLELVLVEKKVAPACKEALDVLIKNFLSFGDIPSKSKLISIMTSLARKHQVQLLVHLSIQNVIDNLVYYVISNDLLDPYKKKEISDSLIRLKMEPISSEDYMQMVVENEEATSWKQKLIYTQLTRVLIFSSVLIVTLGVCATQFKASLTPQITYLINWFLLSTIGFSVLVAAYTLITIFSQLIKPQEKITPRDPNNIPLLTSGSNGSSMEQLNLNASFKKNNNNMKSSAPTQQPLLTQKTPVQRPMQTNKTSQSEKMISIETLKNLTESNEIQSQAPTQTKIQRNKSVQENNDLLSDEMLESSKSAFETI